MVVPGARRRSAVRCALKQQQSLYFVGVVSECVALLYVSSLIMYSGCVSGIVLRRQGVAGQGVA